MKENNLISQYTDGLSLAMFEAFRSLRDAVAPESGNLGGSSGKDTDDLWQSYKNGELPESDYPANLRRDEFARKHAKYQMEKDTGLVMKLAQDVLDQSNKIDATVDQLPGLSRSKSEQLRLIEELIQKNQVAIHDLDQAYERAVVQRNRCRNFVANNASAALGIHEDNLYG